MQATLDDLVRQYIAPVHRLAALIIGGAGGPEDVEEAAGEAFARAWQRMGEFDPARTTMLSWLLMVTKYTALDYRRRLVRQRYTPDGQAKVIPLEAVLEPAAPSTPEDEAARRERSQQLHAALAQLPESDRELLVRRYFLEHPIGEIALEMGLSRTAVDSRLFRARQALKAMLNEEANAVGNSAV